MDTTETEKNEFPVEHWLAMGLTGHGGYNADVYWVTASMEGKAEKKKVDCVFIQKQLAEYGKTYWYCSAVHLLLLLGIFLSVFCNILRRGAVREA